MEFLISFGLSLSFGIFWMWWFYRRDKFEREPIRFVALIFILTMPLSVLAGLFEFSLDGNGEFTRQAGFGGAIIFYVGVVAVLEELAKFFVVFTVAYPNRAFNEPTDGIVYAAAAALGFASFENLFYVLDRGGLVLILRGPFTTLGHVLFSALWGAAMGRTLQMTSRSAKIRAVGLGLVLSIGAHGLYNVLISLSYPYFGAGLEWLAVGGIVFLGLLYLVVMAMMNYALKISNFNPRNQTRAVRQKLRQNLPATPEADNNPNLE